LKVKLLRKFLLLPTADKWLLIKAAFLLEATKLCMHLLPFQTLLRLSARAASTFVTRPRHADPAFIDQVAWAVEVASRYTPGAKTCLNQALAAQVLLAQDGYSALIHIGATKGKGGQFQAHAWVESEGKVVIGGSGLECFTPLATLEYKKAKVLHTRR
jgi:Transglutaminase-like superfamily